MKTLSTRSTTLRAGLLGAGVLAALVSAGVAIAASSPDAIKLKALPLPSGGLGTPFGTALSSNGKTLYVADEARGLVVINLAHPSQNFALEDGAQAIAQSIGLALAPNGKTLYVDGEAGGDYGIFIVHLGGSKATDQVVGEIKDPSDFLKALPAGLAVSSNGKYLYAGVDSTTTTPAGPAIVVATLGSATSGTLVKRVSEPKLGLTTALIWGPKHKYLYAANVLGPAAVLKVSGEKISVAAELPEAQQLVDLALSPNGRELYGDTVGGRFFDSDQPTVSVIDTFGVSKSGLGATLQGTTSLSSSLALSGISLTASGKTAYAAVLHLGPSSPSVSGGLDEFSVPKP
jgi:DNA-binding beta-propeller fold protein YncE